MLKNNNNYHVIRQAAWLNITYHLFIITKIKTKKLIITVVYQVAIVMSLVPDMAAPVDACNDIDNPT